MPLSSKPEAGFFLPRLFVAIALIFGHLLIAIIPPFQVADEPQHFFRAYQITEGVLINNRHDALGIGCGELPSSLYRIWLPFSYLGFHADRKAHLGEIFQVMQIPLDPQNQLLTSFGSTSHYSPACYLPQCVGISIARILRLPPLAMLYLGRDCNLLFWTLLGWLALRQAPEIARPLFFILLLPMSLYNASSLSADAPTAALAALFTATAVSFAATAGRLSIAQYLCLLLLSLGVCLCKFAYAPLLLLLLAIPQSRSGPWLPWLLKIAVIVTLAVGASIFFAGSSGLSTQIRLSPIVSARSQFQLVEAHPIHFAAILLHTLQRRSWFLIDSFVGIIGWLDQDLPLLFIAGFITVLLLNCFPGDDAPPPSPLSIVALCVIPAVTLSFLIICFLSYLYWTAVGGDVIDGIHGRYLIPLAPALAWLLCAAFGRFSLRLPFATSRLNQAAAIFAIGFSTWFVLLVWMRYWA